jgi:hypothetical protein
MMLAVLERHEQKLNAAGWDNVTPALSVVGVNHRRRECRVQHVPFPALTSERLMEVAATFAYADADTSPLLDAVRASMADRFAGAVFSSEAWIWLGDEPPESGRSIGDQPGGREMRMVFAVDTANRTYIVRRLRGEQEPTCQHELYDGSADRETQLEGLIPDALRLLAAGLAARHPTSVGEHRLPALPPAPADGADLDLEQILQTMYPHRLSADKQAEYYVPPCR